MQTAVHDRRTDCPARKTARPTADGGPDRLAPLPANLTKITPNRKQRHETAARILPKLLAQLEAPPIDDAARQKLLTVMYLSGSEAATLVIRLILETGPEGANATALCEPAISAVYSVTLHRPDWVRRGLAIFEAFDKLPPISMLLDVMRGLDLFRERSLGHYLFLVLMNKLQPLLDEPTSREAARMRREKEEQEIAAARRRRNERVAAANPKIKALYGNRPEILDNARPNALEVLASLPLPPEVRAKFERQIVAGELVTARAVTTASRAANPRNVKATSRQIVERGLMLLKKKPGPRDPVPVDLCNKLGVNLSEVSVYCRAARLYGKRIKLVENLKPTVLKDICKRDQPPEYMAAVDKRLAKGERITLNDLSELAAEVERAARRAAPRRR